MRWGSGLVELSEASVCETSLVCVRRALCSGGMCPAVSHTGNKCFLKTHCAPATDLGLSIESLPTRGSQANRGDRPASSKYE